MIPLLPIGEGPGEYDRVSVLSIFPGDYPSIGIYEANKMCSTSSLLATLPQR